MRRLLQLSMRTHALPRWVGYAGATLLVAVAAALRWALFGPETGPPFLLFLAPAIATALFFDRGTSIYAAVLGTAVALSHLGPGGLRTLGPDPLSGAATFLIVALVAALPLERLQRAFWELAEAHGRLAAADAEKDLLMRELVHRARNDLQVLASALRLQAHAADEPAAREALLAAEGRVRALARLGARLGARRAMGIGESVNSRDFLAGLAEDLRGATGSSDLRSVAIEAEVEAHALPVSHATPLGLITNELVANALKYAFPGGRAGTVCIRFWREDADFVLAVDDSGAGLGTPKLTAAEALQGTGLGQKLGRALAAQLGGRLQIGPRPGGGTRAELRFPAPREQAFSDPGEHHPPTAQPRRSGNARIPPRRRSARRQGWSLRPPRPHAGPEARARGWSLAPIAAWGAPLAAAFAAAGLVLLTNCALTNHLALLSDQAPALAEVGSTAWTEIVLSSGAAPALDHNEHACTVRLAEERLEL